MVPGPQVKSGSLETGWTNVVCRIQHRVYFEGANDSSAAIQFYGMFGSVLSFENVATELARQVVRWFDEVACHDYRYPPTVPRNVFPERAFLNPNAPVGIYHGTLREELPKIMAGHRFRVGCLVCEADRVSEQSVQTANESFDLVVVPSKYCRRVFQSSGLTVPVLLVPHGVSDVFEPGESTAPSEAFTFYNVYSQLRQFRKSEEELVRCFVKAFDRDPKIHLRLRTTRSNELDARLDHNKARDVISVDEEPLGEDRYAQRFSEMHATVHPSKAEGFGIVPLQSLACEVPVIAPLVTGMTEYLSEANAMPLRTLGPVPADGGAGDGGNYYAIDEAHLIECMRRMVEQWPAEKRRAQRAGAYVRRYYNWSEVTRPLLDTIERQLNTPGAAATAAEPRTV